MNLKNLDTVHLQDIDQVKLMNRVDTKFWFNANKLSQIFNQIKEHYFILEIENKKILSYSTTYYDTALNSMYTAHHNGKLNRYKVRHRTYVESGISFLEIKQKSNKGRTIKKRIPTNQNTNSFNAVASTFLGLNCPFTSDELKPAIQNSFKRITLVSKKYDERCTIDMDLSFSANKTTLDLDDLAIVEIKTDGLPTNSPLKQILSSMGIKSAGFSKYCIGRAMISPDVKHNKFKTNIRKINKTIYNNN